MLWRYVGERFDEFSEPVDLGGVKNSGRNRSGGCTEEKDCEGRPDAHRHSVITPVQPWCEVSRFVTKTGEIGGIAALAVR
ncbi:MAG: hypothetical protein JOZ80_06780 [Acidobacteriaceae bacterium]|nr:hypothetical protein [Acidobacteriaceae bacterium]